MMVEFVDVWSDDLMAQGIGVLIYATTTVYQLEKWRRVFVALSQLRPDRRCMAILCLFPST
jgi:hypothetical protein